MFIAQTVTNISNFGFSIKTHRQPEILKQNEWDTNDDVTRTLYICIFLCLFLHLIFRTRTKTFYEISLCIKIESWNFMETYFKAEEMGSQCNVFRTLFLLFSVLYYSVEVLQITCRHFPINLWDFVVESYQCSISCNFFACRISNICVYTY